MADYDLICAGTGFASSFFLHRWLERRKKPARVLVLEAGKRLTHAEQVRGAPRYDPDSFVNLTPEKPWIFTRALGGGSNCWWACTPRMLPADFEMRTRYGVGTDWPVSYEDLEPYYCDAEEILGVAGPSEATPFVRSRPYPLPPHRFSDSDTMFKEAHPEQFFHMPSARPTRATGARPRCCNNGVCWLCPIDSKFTVLNGLPSLYDHEGVTILTAAAVQSVELEAGRATGVRYLHQGKEKAARADLVQLGANALFNAHILLRSGFDHPKLGRGVCEQSSRGFNLDLVGVENFGGSTSVTGHGYMLYDGPHRKRHAGALLETWNSPRLRMEPGRWRQRMHIKLIYEEMPREESTITVDPGDPSRPRVKFAGYSEYNRRGQASAEVGLRKVLQGMPVERVLVERPAATESHVIGGTVMGSDPATSIVDRDLVHHRVRNLVVLGCGSFPTAPPANPTLTLCALSLRAADRLS